MLFTPNSSTEGVVIDRPNKVFLGTVEVRLSFVDLCKVFYDLGKLQRFNKDNHRYGDGPMLSYNEIRALVFNKDARWLDSYFYWYLADILDTYSPPCISEGYNVDWVVGHPLNWNANARMCFQEAYTRGFLNERFVYPDLSR